MNKIFVKDLILNNNRIEVIYKVEGEWSKFFNKETSFYVEYSFDTKDLPYSVAIIPFVSNVLPLIWLFDGELTIESIDKDFYESIEEFKKGYIDMYPKVDFEKGNIKVEKIVENKQDSNNETSALLFSGGVDSYHSLITNIDKMPKLITLWGADIKLEDKLGWEKVKKHNELVKDNLDVDYLLVKSSFREFINEELLSQYISAMGNDGWWHDFQHGIGILSHVAPISYKYGIKDIFIASTYSSQDPVKTPCASDPTIDNHVRFVGSSVIHDGYELNRQEKVREIIEYANTSGNKVNLRVCFLSSGGSNCCHCEKCYTTILAIIAEKEDPRDFGFDYSDDEFKGMMRDMKLTVDIDPLMHPYIQKALRENFEYEDINKNLRWFYRLDMNHNKSKIEIVKFKLIRRLYNLLKK